jgi:hypothetical protein
MNDDERVGRLAAQSRVSLLVATAVRRFQVDARRSCIATWLRRLRAHIAALAPLERIRLVGALLVTASATNALLVRSSPTIARPGASTVWDLVFVVAGLAMMFLARRIAPAWTTSHLRELLVRGRGRNSRDGASA